jgi:hypothetical protein
MPQPTTLQRQVLQAIGFDKAFGPADVARVIDELAVVIAALCVADPIMCDRFIERFGEALAEGERRRTDIEREIKSAKGPRSSRHH